MITISERDWKIIRDLKPELLNLSCEQIFHRIEKLSAGRAGQQHQTYLKLYKLIEKEDEKIAKMFNDLKRSNAFFKIAALRLNGVLTDAQMELFTEQTQAIVKDLCQFGR